MQAHLVGDNVSDKVGDKVGDNVSDKVDDKVDDKVKLCAWPFLIHDTGKLMIQPLDELIPRKHQGNQPIMIADI